MSDPPDLKREVIDVDDLDVFCTGIRHCVRIDRPQSPRHRKRAHDPDNEDTKVASSSRSTLPQDNS